MNSARSTALGWGALIAAAGVSFFYAKRSIDDRRREQHASGQRPGDIKDWKQRIEAPPPPEQPAPQRTNEDGSHNYTKSPTPDEAFKKHRPDKN